MKRSKKSPDTNWLRKLRGILGVLLVIGLILIIPLFFAIQIRATPLNIGALNINTTGTPYATFTAQPGGVRAPGGIPVTPPAPVAPAPSVVISAKEPPACNFPLAQTTTEESAPENYTFSDPKPVPLDPSWDYINLYQWLPDNQRVLMGRGYPDQIISLLNPQTGENQDFGSRPNPNDEKPPVWIPNLNAVLYSRTLVLTPITFSDNGNGPAIIPPSFDYRRQLWLSRGDPDQPQPLVDEPVTVPNDRAPEVGERFGVAASPDGSEIVYLDSVGKQLFEQKLVQGSFEKIPSPPFDATRWIYRTPDNSVDAETFWNLTWRPDSTQVLLYSGIQTARIGGYTFLLDTQSGKICELNLWKDDPSDWRKIWAPFVHWSPNGRYLAVVRTRNSTGDVDFNDLIILDTATGKLYQIEPAKLNAVGSETQRNPDYISDVAWAPDNRHLAAIVAWKSPPNSMPEVRLFLLDFVTGQSSQITSAELWPFSDITSNLLWSDDGSKLTAECRTEGLCLIFIQK